MDACVALNSRARAGAWATNTIVVSMMSMNMPHTKNDCDDPLVFEPRRALAASGEAMARRPGRRTGVSAAGGRQPGSPFRRRVGVAPWRRPVRATPHARSGGMPPHSWVQRERAVFAGPGRHSRRGVTTVYTLLPRSFLNRRRGLSSATESRPRVDLPLRVAAGIVEQVLHRSATTCDQGLPIRTRSTAPCPD